MHNAKLKAVLTAASILGCVFGSFDVDAAGTGEGGGRVQDAIGDPVGDALSPEVGVPGPDILVVNAFTNAETLTVEVITDTPLSSENGPTVFVDADQDAQTGNTALYESICPQERHTGAEFVINSQGTILDSGLTWIGPGTDAVVVYNGNRVTFSVALTNVGITDGRANIQVHVQTGAPSFSTTDCGPDDRSVEANSALTADYQFQGNLVSRTLNAPDLAETGIGRGFGVETVLGVFRQVRTFSAGNGLRVDPTSGLIAGSVYTIQMQVRIEDITGGGSNFVKLVDFGNQSDDRGLYAEFAGGNPTITFFDSPVVAPGIPSAFPDNEWTQIVITRDANRNVTGYIDGVEQFAYITEAGASDVSGPLVFLDDDAATGGGEVSGGAIACLRIYPTAMSGSEVAALDCAPLRVGLNGNACAFTTINEAVMSAQSGDEVFIEVGSYNERIGQVGNKDLTLRSSTPGSNCTMAEPVPGGRAIVDGAGFTEFVGLGGILDIRSSSVSLIQVDLTNGTTGQGGLVYVDNGAFSMHGSTLSDGTASSDLVLSGSPATSGGPSGGCIHAEGSDITFLESEFINCRVIGPNNGAEPADGDGGAIHARFQSTVDGRFVSFADGSAQSGAAIWGSDSVITLGSSSTFERNAAITDGGAIGIFQGSLEINDSASFIANSAGARGGAIQIVLGDLAIRPSSNELAPTRFEGNFAGDAGGAISIIGNPGVLSGPTIQGVEFFDNDSSSIGGAIRLSGADVEIVDSSFIANSANIGGGIALTDSSAVITSSEGCKAFEFDDPNEYCSQFVNNFADFASAIIYATTSTDNQISTSAFVGNSGPQAVIIGIPSSLSTGVSMESVWFHDNSGDAILSRSDSTLEIIHGTFDANAGRAYVGQDSSALRVFNSIAFDNAVGGFSSIGSGALDTGCNIDQSGIVGINIDPLFVDAGDGSSHLDQESPAVDVCFDQATLPVDLEGRPRFQGAAPDMGAFETTDVMFENGFEAPALR